MKQHDPVSLRLRLIGLILATITVVWLLTSLITYHQAREELDELLDAHLAQTASLLISQTLHEMREGEEMHDQEFEATPLLHRYARKLAYQVWRAKGGLAFNSVNAPTVAMGDNEPGFEQVTIDGIRWRVFSAWGGENEVLVHVGEQSNARDDVARELIIHLLQPLLLALPLLAILLAIAIKRALRPLEAVVSDLATRAPDNLAPLSLSDAPVEITPLVARLNELFAGINRALDNERRFTADAAHELRTPLAAIKAQAQVAQAADRGEERQHALGQIVLGCDRAAHLVEQLLTLARLDALTHDQLAPVALRAIAADILASSAGMAIEHNCDLDLREGEAMVRGDPVLLRVLLRNLVENSVIHGGEGTRIEVSVESGDAGVQLSVQDNGRGIAADKRDSVLQRFFRIADTPATGSGLGLSIVSRIAELHGARLAIDAAPGGGTRVRVTFPA